MLFTKEFSQVCFSGLYTLEVKDSLFAQQSQVLSWMQQDY